MGTALVEARIPEYDSEKKDYSKSRVDLYFINEEGSISNETGDSHVKNCDSFEEALPWLEQFISFYLKGKILSVIKE